MDKFHLKPAAGNESHARAGSPAIDSQLGSRDEFFSTHLPSRPVTPMNAEGEPPRAARLHGRPRKIVLCFDGTGNKFHGDDSDSNILKIFRMLDRTASDQCKTCFFPPPPTANTKALTQEQTTTTSVCSSIPSPRLL
jgi:hypothetical protein